MSQDSASGGNVQAVYLPTVIQRATKSREKATKPSLHQDLLRQRLSRNHSALRKCHVRGFTLKFSVKGETQRLHL